MAIEENDFFSQCEASPAFFAREVLGIEPTPQQLQLLDAISLPGAHVAVRSGHGTGKSTSLAIIALWFLCTRPDAKVPCTAPAAHQLEDVLWGEIRRLHAGMGEWTRDQIRIKADKITIDGSAGYIVARTARKDNPDALQGFHAENILFIIDEAAGVHDKIFEVAQGALSTPGARVVMTANPTQLTGYFFDAFNINRDNWIRLHFNCIDSPLVDPSYAEGMAREYGEDSDIFRIRVLGEFPRFGLLAMIPADRVDSALARKLPLDAVSGAPVILGVDPAWMGSDRSAVIMRQSIFARVLFAQRGVNGERLANIVARYQDEYNAVATFVDRTGVGASVCDFLTSLGRPFTGVSFAGQALEPEKYLNRRAEIWWQMREWFDLDVCLEMHPDIKNDLIGPEYGMRDNGKIYLESKDSMRERGLHSPDLGDGLALTFASPVVRGGGARVIQNDARERLRQKLRRR